MNVEKKASGLGLKLIGRLRTSERKQTELYLLWDGKVQDDVILKLRYSDPASILDLKSVHERFRANK